jgi:hypothetical protein
MLHECFSPSTFSADVCHPTQSPGADDPAPPRALLVALLSPKTVVKIPDFLVQPSPQ